ncbi:MAG: hypothetical protein P8168_11600 [Deltaproteobacteria bacterium]|jgi:hypothetical protein
MAIKGLTPQLAERGKIKIGEKGETKTSQGGKQFAQPRKLDHFVITTMQRDAAGRLMPDTGLMARINPEGKKLVEIPVRLLYDDIDLNFLTRYSCYKGNRCWCSGDGEVAARLTGENGKYQEVSCPCERQDPLYQGNDKCKTLGTLQVLIEGVDRIGGVWKFRTTSWNTVNAVLSSLALIKTITGGPLAGIPLLMVLSPKTVTVPTTGQNMVVFVVSLEYRGPEKELAELGYELAKRRMEHRVRMETIEEQARKLLVAPHQEPPQEQEETAAEFFPEGAAAGTEGGDGQGTAEEQVYTIPQGNKQASPEPQEAVTLPALMEQVKKSPDALSNFPIPLVTTKGVAIGWCRDYAVNLGGEMQITLELVDNLEEVTEGLTLEMIKKSFQEAGITVKVLEGEDVPPGYVEQTPGAGLQASELPSEKNGVMQVKIGPGEPDQSQSASEGKKTHLKPVQADGESKKSLF